MSDLTWLRRLRSAFSSALSATRRSTLAGLSAFASSMQQTTSLLTVILEHTTPAVIAVSFFCVRQIRRVRQSLDAKTAKTLLQAFVTSRVDYCNAVLAESPRVITDKLQRVMVPSTWNSLPDSLRDPELSRKTFKRQLKTYIFTRY